MDSNWIESNVVAPIDAGELHLWLVPVQHDEAWLEGVAEGLRGDDLRRFRSLSVRNTRNRFLTSRYLLRNLLGQYLNASPRDIAFKYGAHGKPILRDDNSLHFNISHSRNYSLLAFSREHALGIDLEERSREVSEYRLAMRYFSEAERQLMDSFDNAKHGFLEIWTRKEAILKASGDGLTVDIAAVNVLPDTSERVGGYLLRSINLPEDLVGSLAFTGENPVLKQAIWKF